MTRRLLASLTLATVIAGGLGAFATPASATEEEYWICIGGENQRKPGFYKFLCFENAAEGTPAEGLVSIGPL